VAGRNRANGRAQTFGDAGDDAADRILAAAAEDARLIEAGVDERVRLDAEQRLRRIEQLRSAIAEHSERIESAYVNMTEAMAAASKQLVEISRRADFTAPAWPGGIERTVELKLSETREMTLRIGPQAAGDRQAPERDYNRPWPSDPRAR
jgi:hypothetical protein